MRLKNKKVFLLFSGSAHSWERLWWVRGVKLERDTFFCLSVFIGVEFIKDFLGGSDGRVSACSSGDQGFNPWVGKIPWRRKWPPTPVFLPGESHGQRSLEGYSPWGRRVGHDWGDLACTMYVCQPQSLNLSLLLKIGLPCNPAWRTPSAEESCRLASIGSKSQRRPRDWQFMIQPSPSWAYICRKL